MSSKRRRDLFLPALVEEHPKAWEVYETEIRDAAVDLAHRKAYVPQALTRAQRQARLHELGHVKYSPRQWSSMVKDALAVAEERGEAVDPGVVLQISKMLEENRVDWLLWDRHEVDVRPARESLDWEHMQVPIEPLTALHWVFQLAWTVWGSRGVNAAPLIQPPPPRTVDPQTAAFFDQCWAVISNHHPSLAPAMVRGCLEMYREPTHATRNRVAAELATFFPPPEEHAPPPAKQEERQAQEEARAEIEQQEQARERDEGGGVADNQPVNHGHYEVHDHTAGIRRPSLKIARRETPQSTGTKLTFPHRYMLDRSVFGRRILNEGGIMIDGSGSMNWTNDDLMALLERMPAVWIGIYSGFYNPARPGVIGRICILAKRGRFSRFDGLDAGHMPANMVDLEALQLLAKWPKPRFWLSDGFVNSGRHSGPHPDPSTHTAKYLRADGKLVDKVDRFIKANDILRVSTKEDILKLVKRQRVTLYRSCMNLSKIARTREPRSHYYPDDWREQPVRFQL